MGKHWNEKELDAYGHLNWTVGNADWIACFDAIRVADGIRYHVVVDCESGGFIDTVEDGTVPLEKVGTLFGLPEQFASICLEQYAKETEDRYQVSDEDTEDCAARWKAHLEELAAQPPPEPDEEEHDEMEELRRAALSRGQP